MPRHRAPICTWFLFTIIAPISASQSPRPPLPRRDGVRLQVHVWNTTLLATVGLRFLIGTDSLNGGSRVVSVPYDQTFPGQQLSVRVEPPDPRAQILVVVDRWRDGKLQEEGSVTGSRIMVQVQRGVLRLAAGPLRSGIWPVRNRVFGSQLF